MSKSHLEYWKDALRKQKLPRVEWESTGRTKDWEVYIQYRGRREWFNLGSASKEVAAAKAREIWLTLRTLGWEPALAKFKPNMLLIVRSPTVGEFLKLVEGHSTLRPSTFRVYSGKLRSLSASIRGLDSDDSKFDHWRGGHLAWRKQVESTKLCAITPPKVQAWKQEVLRKAGDCPIAQKRARQTINSVLRNVKALFSEKLLRNVPVTLDRPLPTEGIDFEKAGRTRYRSRIDAFTLFASAQSELRSQYPESYKVFLLALAAGLRRKEIDGLLWSQVDFAHSRISIEAHIYGDTKTEESEDEIDISAEILTELRLLHESRFPQSPDFVVMSPRKARSSPSYAYYRCEPHFEHLITWLKAKGVPTDKPIHTLRKEFGSVIAAKHGIFAASMALRHANITTTRDHYIDKKTSIAFEFASS